MFDTDALEFLKALNPSTRSVYQAGLEAFLDYYKRPLNKFLDEVEGDLHKPRRERRRVARKTLIGFVEWLKDQGYAPKTIRTYTVAVQSLAKYYDVPLSLRYVSMPSSQPVSSKFPWTIEKVAEFIDLIPRMDVKSLSVTLFQSGLSMSDALALTYGDIKYEFEHGVVPLCLDLSRIKTGVPFLTFIGRWGVSMLRKHLEGRSLKDETPIYKVSPRTVDHWFKKVGERLLGSYRGRNPMRPHSLRAAFRTLLGDAGMGTDEIRFFMGHRLPEQERVYMSRSREGWRELYKSHEKHLTPPGEW